MAGALFYLTICSMRNRLLVKLKRLREPRYLVGLIAGGLYFYRFFFRPLLPGAPSDRAPGSASLGFARHAAVAQFIGGVALFGIAALAWLWPVSHPPFTFTRAEVQFLFQAPLSRRQLVHYKLIRMHTGTLFMALMATLFLRPSSLAAGGTLLAGIWLLFSIMAVHNIGISLSRQSPARRSVAGFARQWLPVALVVGSIGVLGTTLAIDWSHLERLASPRAVFHDVEAVMSAGAAAIVLWPFRAIVRVPLAQTAAQFWSALPAALLIAAVNYVWVLSADASFEEASAAQADKIVTRMASRQAIRPVKPTATPTPFTLSPAGPPETAILWKNLIMLGRYASLKTLLPFLPLLVVFGLLAQRPGVSGSLLTVAAIGCLFGVAATLLLGPQLARNDLRQDLGNLAVLKTWPLTGTTLLRGELLAPMVVLTSIAWLLILGAWALSGHVPVADAEVLMSARDRFPYAAAAMLAAPALILAQLVVQNGLAIAFPAWIVIGPSRARGVDIMGQRLIMMAGHLIVLALSIVPGAIVAALVALVFYLTSQTISVVLPALSLSIVLVMECAFAVDELGRLLDRTDVNAVDARE
jgi:hypothetical protein